MSRNTRAASQPHTALKAIGLPRPVEVRTGADGLPAAVARTTHGAHGAHGTHGARSRRAEFAPVESIEEAWRVGEEWWREAPLERTYYLLLLEGGRPITVFHDGVFNAWFEQQY